MCIGFSIFNWAQNQNYKSDWAKILATASHQCMHARNSLISLPVTNILQWGGAL